MNLGTDLIIPLAIEKPSQPLLVTEEGEIIIEEIPVTCKRKSSGDDRRKKIKDEKIRIKTKNMLR